jgi:hypothetical protein
MSKNSAQQRVDQVQEWYKWFNKKYNRYNRIKARKQAKLLNNNDEAPSI